MLALALFWPSFGMARQAIQLSASGQLPPDSTIVTGIARTPSVARSTGGTVFELSAVTANGVDLDNPVTIQVQMPDRRTGPTFGQLLRVSGKLGTANQPLNPGEERPGLPPADVFLARELQVLPHRSVASWWGRLTGRARDLLERRARPLLNYRAYGFLVELLLHRRLFGTADRQLFSITGTSHLLSFRGSTCRSCSH